MSLMHSSTFVNGNMCVSRELQTLTKKKKKFCFMLFQPNDHGFSTSSAVQLLKYCLHISSFYTSYCGVMLCLCCKQLWTLVETSDCLRPQMQETVAMLALKDHHLFPVGRCEAISFWCPDTIQLILCEIRPSAI